MSDPTQPADQKRWLAKHKVSVGALVIIVVIFLTVYATRILPTMCQAQATEEYNQQYQAFEQSEQGPAPGGGLITITQPQDYRHCVDTLDLHTP